MRVIGKLELKEYQQKYTDAQAQLDTWLCEVEEAQWQSFNDIRKRYATASLVGKNTIVFNIKGNKYRLVTKVSFKNKIILIMKFGTHAEYSKWTL